MAGRIADAESRPRTFSMTTSSGCSASIAAAMCDHSPERVPGARPAPLPTVETSWQGNPPMSTSTGGTVVHSTAEMSPRFGMPGQWRGEDADGGVVDLGEPDRLPACGIFDGEVEAAVAAEQRTDSGRAAAVGMVVAHEGSRGFVNPGPRRD